MIQGFGNAGSYLAKFMHDAGAKVVGVSDVYGAIADPNGIDINYLLDRRDSFGTFSKLFTNTITNKELFELDCDILVPAAIANQITAENAANIKASIVVEAANGPTTLEATKILTERGVSSYQTFCPMPAALRFLILNGCKITKAIIGPKKKWNKS